MEKMEKHVPFIAAIVSGVITWIATALFLRQYLALTTIVLLVGIPLLRFNAWALIGGFLTGVATDLLSKGATEQLRVVVLMLIIGSGLQLAVAILPTFVRGLRLPESSLGQNMFFAFIGIILSYAFAFLRCSALVPIPKGAHVTLGRALAFVMYCQSMEPFVQVSNLVQAAKEYGPEFWNAVGLACLWILIMSPMTWAVFFAALRQVNFNLLDPGRLLARTFMAFLGLVFIGGLLSFLVGALVLFLGLMIIWFSPIIALIPGVETIQSLPPDHVLWEAIAVLIAMILILIIDFGAACGARWGASQGE